MYFGNLKKNDVANGEGVRTSLFVSGCRNGCKNCFNRETWAFDFGEPYTEATEADIIDSCKPSYNRGLTVLGGEPMEPENQRVILSLLKKFKEIYPEKTIWLYTGNLYEELMGEVGSHYKCLDITRELLSYVDILVDGRYVEEQKSLGLRFRGSSNQRVIDMNKTRAQGSIVIWSGCKEDKKYNQV